MVAAGICRSQWGVKEVGTLVGISGSTRVIRRCSVGGGGLTMEYRTPYPLEGNTPAPPPLALGKQRDRVHPRHRLCTGGSATQILPWPGGSSG